MGKSKDRKSATANWFFNPQDGNGLAFSLSALMVLVGVVRYYAKMERIQAERQERKESMYGAWSTDVYFRNVDIFIEELMKKTDDKQHNNQDLSSESVTESTDKAVILAMRQFGLKKLYLWKTCLRASFQRAVPFQVFAVVFSYGSLKYAKQIVDFWRNIVDASPIPEYGDLYTIIYGFLAVVGVLYLVTTFVQRDKKYAWSMAIIDEAIRRMENDTSQKTGCKY